MPLGEIGHGHTTIMVVVKQPEVEHKVRTRDLEGVAGIGLSLTGPVNIKTRIRELASK